MLVVSEASAPKMVKESASQIKRAKEMTAVWVILIMRGLLI